MLLRKQNVSVKKVTGFNVINKLKMKYILVLLFPVLLYSQQEYKYDSNKSNCQFFTKRFT